MGHPISFAGNDMTGHTTSYTNGSPGTEHAYVSHQFKPDDWNQVLLLINLTDMVTPMCRCGGDAPS